MHYYFLDNMGCLVVEVVSEVAVACELYRNASYLVHSGVFFRLYHRVPGHNVFADRVDVHSVVCARVGGEHVYYCLLCVRDIVKFHGGLDGPIRCRKRRFLRRYTAMGG